MSYQKFNIQLHDSLTGEVIDDAGGVCFVVGTGTSAKSTLYSDKVGTSLANPLSITNGLIEFWTGVSVSAVDLYILAPGGQFVVAKNIKPSGPNEIMVDTNARHQTMVIPFDHADFTAAAETDSGFDEPADAIFLPYAAVRVVDLDDTETIDVGTDSGDSGDADGFIDGLTVATAATHKATLADGAATLGVLLKVDESAGDFVPEGHVSTEKSITYTLSAGSDTAAGFIILPYVLTGA